MKSFLTAINRQPDVEHNVRAQALVRFRLGFPVLTLLALTAWYWGPASPDIGIPHIAAIAIAYTGYNFAMLFLAHRPQLASPGLIVIVTAIVDPAMLSIWLSVLGRGASLFVPFYLFTILGFGFRVGVGPMRLCQAASLVGFAYVAVTSPVWREQPLVAFSGALFLIVVPLYAATLIKQLRDARELAERESRAKSQLLANVSHELRTPLSAIVSSAQLIQSESADPAAAERAASILKVSADLNAEIDNLLDSAKQQVNRLTLARAPFDVPALVEKVRATLAPNAAVKGIALSAHVDEGIVLPVLGDSHYLTSVLANLGGNAVKFTEQGRVDIEVDLVEVRGGQYVLRFAVRDTGIGIAPELHERIFEPFFQVSTGTTRRYGGTGLGTSIARQIVNLMGGELRLESTPGQGSRFWFEVALDTVAEVAPEQPAQAPVPIVRGKRVLIADDNETNLILTRELLRKDDHAVVAAHSGVEALEALNVMPFDVVFLDFNMADMDGATVFELYRFGKLQTAPTYFLTADTTEETATRLRELGVAGVLHKPVTFEKLRGALLQLFPDEAVALEETPSPAVSAAATAPARPSDMRKADERPAAATSQGAAVAGWPPLSAVPTEYIDHGAIDALQEISTAPEFLVEVLSAGIADIERLGVELADVIESGDAEQVRLVAHALKGVSLNMGAVRLGTLAGRLMNVSAAELRRNGAPLYREIAAAIGPSIAGLRAALAAAA
jgi:two-component system sensor histidine kinase RpfC